MGHTSKPSVLNTKHSEESEIDVFIAIHRWCDAEDPFWSDCEILGLFSSREEATNACEESRKRKMRGDPTSCEEVEANYNELFAMMVGSMRRHNWRVETIELKESNKK